MASQTYDDARTLIESISTAEFDLAPYTGSLTDLAYLKDWVLDHVTSIYGVAASVFDTATIYSTTILRDFVHRAVYQNSDATYIDTLAANGELISPQTEDVATAFRYPAYGACGLLAWQMYQVFTAFDYKTNLLAFMNGDFGAGAAESFNDSHASTEVFLEDYGKYAIQDATFNFIYTDSAGSPLSWREAADALRNEDLTFDNFDIYTYYLSSGEPITGEFPASLQDQFINNYFKVPHLWAHDGAEPGTDGSLYKVFPNWSTAHDSGSYQGGTYDTADSAWDDIAALRSLGADWIQIANSLNDAHYTTGFRVGQTEWITIRLATGDYVSFDIHSGQRLNGSYDQIMNDATGNDRNLNPTSDLSFLLNHVDLMSYTGNVMQNWRDTDFAPETLTVRDPDTGALKLWTLDSSPSSAMPFGSPDNAYSLEDRGDYDGDGKSDLLFYRSNGLIGYWDEHQQWHRLDTLNSSWEVQSHTGSSDFWGDDADDILWQNTATGQVVVWDMLNGKKVAYRSLGKVGLDWEIKATADLNNDGTDDILWQNSVTGTIREWLMQNGSVMTNSGIDTVSAPWTILGVGDLTNDGSADILWKNTQNGVIAVWDMDNGHKTSYTQLDALSSNWELLAIADTDGSGTQDVIWQNSATGEIDYWIMNSDMTKVATVEGTISPDWLIV